ncbi:hypothetical protein [Helicobacter sp. 11S02596-1]|uniref:hypothetical protein n=1 Tax=Helicobacter sp. 11S02596-1 TaxID=1476194 RepID=UPI000BA71CF9|nr:hypothetical protein [Helicobacter sp. 11S02596-1]PAF44755.1 hypothetical protein BJI48_01845 [Helicobacter sp. 11S02596-1]
MTLISNTLIGKELSSIKRIATMLCLGFGGFFNDGDDKIPCYSLHIQCPFRFILGEKIILASYDISKRFQENLDDKMGNSVFDKLLDERISPLLPLKVIDCICNPLGDIKIIFSNDVILETFIDASLEVEHWRFIDSFSKKHFGFAQEAI